MLTLGKGIDRPGRHRQARASAPRLAANLAGACGYGGALVESTQLYSIQPDSQCLCASPGEIGNGDVAPKQCRIGASVVADGRGDAFSITRYRRIALLKIRATGTGQNNGA